MRLKTTLKTFSFVCASWALVGCNNAGDSSETSGDAEHAAFSDGKADGQSISAGSVAAKGILELANTATLEVLDAPVSKGGVGLDRRAAEGIVKQRPFATLHALDEVPYVGPIALGLLYDHAVEAGLIDTSPAPADAPSVTCSYDTEWLADSASALGDWVESQAKLTPDSELTDLQRNQLWAAVSHLEFTQAGDAFAVIWEHTDDGDFLVSELAHDSAEGGFTWVKFYAGDTQIGTVFNAGTVEIVAEISDGEILGCVPSGAAQMPERPDPEQPSEPVTPGTCTPGGDFVFGNGESADLRDAVTASVELKPDGALTVLQSRQIMAATAVQELNDIDDPLSVAWEASDDGTFELHTVSKAGETYDWIRFYAGDTEVGVVFAGGTETVVGRVDDGWVTSCQ